MIRSDCRHFPGDRPCRFHKADQVVCSQCHLYAPRGKTILVIKLAALGDVLRTTSLLPSLHNRYEPCHVTWITSEGARDLFAGNHLVGEVLFKAEEYIPMLLSRVFDVVINPDANMRACELAAMARGRSRFGFTADRDGTVIPLGDAAGRWLEMGAVDFLKRSNQKTYQEIIHKMCDLDPAFQHIVIGLTEEERLARSEWANLLGIDTGRAVVGLNAGAGRRWQHKKWRIDGFTKLTGMILDRTSANVMLIGGPDDQDRISEIGSGFGPRVSGAPASEIRDLVRTVDLCDVVVTGDTLVLHVALGLGKRVVVLFGPTSSAEIELYRLGTKIVSPIDCVCCYRPDCGRQPTCMDMISAEEVFESVIFELRRVMKERPLAGVPAGAEAEQELVGEPGS